ncbi:GL19717 [Drosophila persimilis]|uniref:GL19717 n=1 Tax=Drosophila persimilis TaxID=7234 RepID=B4HB41_DROPE|nr:GL19717 [Drosophila persimilis]
MERSVGLGASLALLIVALRTLLIAVLSSLAGGAQGRPPAMPAATAGMAKCDQLMKDHEHEVSP